MASATKNIDAVLAATPIDLAKVIRIKRTLEDKVTTLKDLDEKVLDSIDDEAVIADEIQQSDEFLGNIYATLLKAEETLSTRAAPGLSVTTSSASRGNAVRLPKLSFILSLVILLNGQVFGTRSSLPFIPTAN